MHGVILWLNEQLFLSQGLKKLSTVSPKWWEDHSPCLCSALALMSHGGLLDFPFDI